MAKGRPQPQPGVEPKVFATLEEVQQAISKLERRLAEVRGLDPATTRYDDPRVKSVVDNFRNTVLEIYGPNSPEYQRHRSHRIWHGDMYVNMPDLYMQQRFAAGLPHTIEAVENLIRGLGERKADFGADTASRVRGAFEGLDLHPRVAEASAELYRNGHYRNAVLDASLALENYVKQKSRCHDRDGADLMRFVFSRNSPVLAFNALADT